MTKSQHLALQCVGAEVFKRHLMSECYLYRPASSDMCAIDDVSAFDLAEKDCEITIILHLFDSVGKKCLGWSNSVDIDLCALQDESKVKGDVKALTPDKVKITFMPLKRGQHRLLVKVNVARLGTVPSHL